MVTNMKAVGVYLIVGWNLAPVLQFIDKYVFNDWEFVKFLVVICVVDTVLGAYKAIKARDFSSKGFELVFKKLILYSCALITTHVLVHFSVGNKGYVAFSFIDYVIFGAIIFKEAVSIFENIAVIDPKFLPRGILKYLKSFDSYTGIHKIDREEKLKEEEEQELKGK